MTLRAADKRDEHGWQILDENGNVAGYQTSRDKARAAAHGDIAFTGPSTAIATTSAISGEVLSADDSPEAVQARAAWQVDQRIKASIATIRGTWVTLAGDLYIFNSQKMYEHLGFESFNAYVSDPDIALQARWAYKQIEVYEQLVIKRGIDPDSLRRLEITKVVAVMPAIRQGQVTVQEAFADAEALPRRDLELKYSGRASATPGRPDTSTRINTEREPSMGQCPTCGAVRQMDPETGEFIR